MTYILQKKDYLFCQFSLKYVVLILFHSLWERETANHHFLSKSWGWQPPPPPYLVYPTPTNCIVMELGEKLWKKWEFDLYHRFSAL